jgi:ATP-dependent DNA helicase RecG
MHPSVAATAGVLIMNPGGLMPPLNPAELRCEHASRPRNRKIAEMLYYAGWIEKWGGGTLAIIRGCRQTGLPEPQFEEKQGGFWLTLRPRVEPPGPSPTPQATPQVKRLLKAALQPTSRGELQKHLVLKDRVHFLKTFLEPLLAARWIEMTLPEKPSSPRQRYRTTDIGKKALEQ